MKRVNKKALVTLLYPIDKPIHGGQKRARAIVEYYSGLFNQVKVVPIFHRGFYDFDENEDFVIGDQGIIAELGAKPEETEIITGSAPYRDAHLKHRLSELLSEYKPDVVHIEQPFLYEGLKPLLKELGLRPHIIYGSQNIEYILKEKSLRNGNYDVKQTAEVVKCTKEIEEEICHDADLVLAVTKNDAEELKRLGAKNVVIVPNGIEKPQNVLNVKVEKGSIVFVSSGHPPNVKGFFDMLGHDLSFLPPSTKLHIIGSCSEPIKETVSSKDLRNVSFHGEVEESELQTLLAQSEVILLPITEGGGSNLKTAEAILADKKIVATSFAFRSFEQYQTLPNVYIADDPASFKQQVAKALQARKQSRNSDQKESALHVTWQYCLRPLGPAVKRASRRSAKEYVRKQLSMLKHGIKVFQER